MSGTDVREHPPGFSWFLVFTAFFCGALVMVIEVLGSRVIGPFFGVSLFVWTSLITVTLVALAAGYAVGGTLSDRRESPDVLYGLIFAAGLLVLCVPLFKGPVLKLSLQLGLRAGSLLSSFLLFAPPLLLLGCVSPYVIKVAARELERIGRTVGFFYAVSTAGSFAGTVLTGFVLITLFGVDAIFTAAGGGLILLALTWFVLFRRKWLFLAALALPLLPLGPSPPGEIVLENGARVRVLHERDSFYGNLKVLDYDYGFFKARELAIDGLVQGGVDLRDGRSIYAYPYFLELIPRSINPGGRSCLVVGLGTGIVPRWYERRGVVTDVVDIDPEVPRIAKEYFSMQTKGAIAVEDARYYLRTSKKSYDYVILDVFSGDTTPGHLLSVEALELARSRLAKGGVLAANIIGTLSGETSMTASVVRTFREVFPAVECYPAFAAKEPGDYGNIVIVAHDGTNPPAGPVLPGRADVHPLAFDTVRSFIGRPYEFPPGAGRFLLTDDYNPIDFFDLAVKESLRRDILRHTAADVLI